MTRWLYLSSDLGIPLDGTKGASEHVRAITRALCRAGLDVDVLAPRGKLPAGHPAAQLETLLGADVRRVAEDIRSGLGRIDASTGMASEIGQLLYDSRLHDWMERPGALPEVSVVLERHCLFSTAGRSFARRTGAAYLVEMNAPLSQEAARYRDAGLCELARHVEAQTLLGADRVLTVSDALREFVINEYRVPAERVVTVPNGVDLDLFDCPQDRSAARERLGIHRDAIVFGFVGTLRAWHGVDVMLEAFRQIRPRLEKAHLLIVGDGRRVETYRSRAAEMGILDSVTFHGEAPHESIPALLAAMDVALAPYLPQDTFYFSPLKLYEYMAAGLCVVASRAGQIVEVVQAGRNGLLAAPGDVDDLGRAMLEAGRSRSLREHLGAEARRSVADRGWGSVAARIIELAEESCSRVTTHNQERAYVG